MNHGVQLENAMNGELKNCLDRDFESFSSAVEFILKAKQHSRCSNNLRLFAVILLQFPLLISISSLSKPLQNIFCFTDFFYWF
jgi:hypothetical protein